MSKQAAAPIVRDAWETFVCAREEARRRGDRRVGTDHLVLGLLREPALAEALGSDLEAARQALDAMDLEALARVGIEAELGAPPIPTREPADWREKSLLKAVLTDRLPLTPTAKSTMEACHKKMKRGHSTNPYRAVLMLDLLSLTPPDPAAALLDALAVDRSAVLARCGDR